ncbi:MAG: ABC transporter permease subunit [Actinomycetota bacterium]|nr:ABC transporter permease subunit [Actinomycetota bacterium]
MERGSARHRRRLGALAIPGRFVAIALAAVLWPGVRSVGMPRSRVVVRHVLPNSLGPAAVGLILGVGTAILEAAGRSLLGLGASDPATRVGPQLALFPRRADSGRLRTARPVHPRRPRV